MTAAMSGNETGFFLLRQWRMNLRLSEQRVRLLRRRLSSSGLPPVQNELSKQSYIFVEHTKELSRQSYILLQHTYSACQHTLREIETSLRYLGKCREHVESTAREHVFRGDGLPRREGDLCPPATLSLRQGCKPKRTKNLSSPLDIVS